MLTNFIKYKLAYFFMKYNGSCDLLEIKACGCLPILVTPKTTVFSVHCIQKGRSRKRNFTRIFDYPKYMCAEKLIRRPVSKNINSQGDYFVIPKIKAKDYGQKIDISQFITNLGSRSRERDGYFIIDENSAWLIGLYVAEGCSHPKSGTIGYYLGRHEIDLIDSVISRIYQMGYTPGFYDTKNKNNTATINFYSKALAKAFKFWCGGSCYVKRIPDFILYNQNLKIVSSFLQGYLKGDGNVCKRKDGIKVFASTVSKILALQLQLISMRLNGFFNIICVDSSKHESKIGQRKICGGYIYRLGSTSSSLVKLLGVEKNDRHNKSYKFFDNYMITPINYIKKINSPDVIKDVKNYCCISDVKKF